MPSLMKGDKILVTGGSGYIGAQVIKSLLKNGFKVVAVFRSFRNEAAGKFVVGAYPSFQDQLSIAVIPDLTTDGAFDDVLAGVDGIAHVASPTTFGVDNPQELIGPAVQSTLVLLRGAKKGGTQLKRVILMSSMATLRPIVHTDGIKTFGDNDWNEVSAAEVQKLGSKAHPADKYAASKVLAEQAAWKFVAEENVSFDLVTIHPSYTFGPFVHNVPSKDKFGTSLAIFNMWLAAAADPSAPVAVESFVDVRDVADLHVHAFLEEKAGGKRIVASNGNVSSRQLVEILQSANLVPKSISGTNPGATAQVAEETYHLDNSRTLELFPTFKFRSFKDAAVDLGRQLDALGWLA